MNPNYKTIQSRFMDFGKSIKESCNNEAKELNGKLELDGSYFGEKRKENLDRECSIRR